MEDKIEAPADVKPQGTVPVAELAQERKRRQEAEAKLAAHEAAQAEGERKRLEEQGQWQKVAEQSRAEAAAAASERDALKPRAAAFEAYQKGQVEQLKASLPPTVLSKLSLENLSLDLQLQVLGAQVSAWTELKATVPPTVTTPGTVSSAGAAQGRKLSPTELAEQMTAVTNHPKMSLVEKKAAHTKLLAAQG